jgi:hypothetical protein
MNEEMIKFLAKAWGVRTESLTWALQQPGGLGTVKFMDTLPDRAFQIARLVPCSYATAKKFLETQDALKKNRLTPEG